MKKIIGFFILGVTASSFTYPNNLPYKVEEIQKSNKKEIPYDLAEYKIILSDIVDSSNIQVKNITLCSNTKCYNSLASKKINIKHSTDGKGNETVSYLIPRSEVIERILFEPSTENNANTITGSIRIKDPTDLKLTEQKYDVDIFITLNKNNNILTPIGAVSMFRSPETVNIFYDRIVALFSQYKNYSTFFENSRKSLEEKRKEIAQKIMDDDSVAVEKIAFEVMYLDKIYTNDINLLFNNLHNLVMAYSEIPNNMVLPKEIIDICSEYEHLVPKTVFVIKDDISAEERVKGTVDKIKNSLNEMGEIENMVSTFKRAVGVEK